jgi:hypothetical protein
MSTGLFGGGCSQKPVLQFGCFYKLIGGGSQKPVLSTVIK